MLNEIYFSFKNTLISLFGDKFLLCNPGWPGTQDPPVTASQMLVPVLFIDAYYIPGFLVVVGLPILSLL